MNLLVNSGAPCARRRGAFPEQLHWGLRSVESLERITRRDHMTEWRDGVRVLANTHAGPHALYSVRRYAAIRPFSTDKIVCCLDRLDQLDPPM